MTVFLFGHAQLSSHLSVPFRGYGSVAVGDASPIENLYIYPSPGTTLRETLVTLYGDRDDFEVTDDTCLAGIQAPTEAVTLPCVSRRKASAPRTSRST
jgi:hypothetical protein